MIRSSWRIRTLASGAPSTAGMPRLRATIAVCDVLPPRSVMKPQKVCVARVLNWSMSAGEISCAMTIFESTGEWSLCVYAAMEAGVFASAFRSCSTTCWKSALRSRKIFILNVIEVMAEFLQLFSQCPFRVIAARADQCEDGLRQRCIVQEEGMYVQECVHLGRRISRQLSAQCFEFPAHLILRCMETRNLSLNLA